MIDSRTIVVYQERMKDRLRQVDKERLLRTALQQPQRESRTYQRKILTRLGHCMMAWGCSLQVRYGVAGQCA